MNTRASQSAGKSAPHSLPGHPAQLTLADLRFDPPTLPLPELRHLALQHFGIKGEFTALAGERDQNHRVRTADGQQFVFKVSGINEPREGVEMQVLALRHIAARDPDLPVPRVMANLSGQHISQAETSMGTHAIRLLGWLPGMIYQEGPFPSAQGLQALGSFLARLGLALSDFNHPAADHFMPWNIANGLVFSKQLRALIPAELDGWLPAWFERLEQQVFPQLVRQRQQVIHQDAHGANLLRAAADSEAVTGVIDFGDIIYGPLVCDLATCATDLVEAASDPLFVAAQVCLGYHRVRPLLDEELELLLDLVMARQIMELQLFEFRQLHMANPPEFVTADQPGIIASLQRLARLDAQESGRQLKATIRNA
jgi:hydroxylysine kinase